MSMLELCKPTGDGLHSGDTVASTSAAVGPGRPTVSGLMAPAAIVLALGTLAMHRDSGRPHPTGRVARNRALSGNFIQTLRSSSESSSTCTPVPA